MKKIFGAKTQKSVHFPLPGGELVTFTKNLADAVSLSSQLSDVPSDIIIKSRIKYGGRWSVCHGLLMEYSKSTTIHGIRYLFEVHRPVYEKLYWLVLLTTSFYFAFFLIWDSYLKWQDSPVILGFDETLVPVHKIPFPTITVCPEIKIDRNIFDFTSASERIGSEHTAGLDSNLTAEEFARFSAILHICESDVVRRFAPHIPEHVRPDVVQTLVDLSISKNETGPFCKWNGRFYFCEKIFNFVATDEGICYQFNGLRNEDIYRDARYMSYLDGDVIDFNNYVAFENVSPLNNVSGQWTLEKGYVNQGYNSYPQRTVFSSARNAFFAFLQGFEHNFDYACRTFKQGYKVFLNSPESVPLTNGNYILVPHGDEVMVSVLPQYVVSSPNLHKFEPKKRQCYFNDERYLRFFRTYSQPNCQTECLSNFTIAKCGCAKFWMPKPPDVPVCGLESIDCCVAAQKELSAVLQVQTMQSTVNASVRVMCDCMPACTSLDYNFEISRAKYDMAKTLEAHREVYEHSDFLGSRLSVYFKERQFTAIKRTMLFSVSTLIANCGGIFGLFMGISSLSVIEVIYFFSVRLFHNLRKRHFFRMKLRKEEQEQREAEAE